MKRPTRPVTVRLFGDGNLGRRGRLVLAVLASWLLAACAGQEQASSGDLRERLNALPGVLATEIQPRNGYPRAFALDITQPVDHDAPSGPTFTQRAYLSHVSEARPLVFGTYGYGATEQSAEELAQILSANGLYVTHRYFPGSRPQPTDWRHLDIRQAAADHHRIATLLKTVYPGPWVSAGASKSGMTALFHRRFHPGDVEATVAYVSPIMFAPKDERFLPWLAATGTTEERQRIHEFQGRLLRHEDALLPLVVDWFTRNGLTFSLPPGPVFEEVVAGYEWSYWQRHVFSPDDIPGPDEPLTAWVDHLAAVVRLRDYSDTSRDYYRAYVYQVHTQLGDGAIDVSPLEGLLQHEPLDPRLEFGLPADLPLAWDGGAAMSDVLRWIQHDGQRIVLLYGGVDPWTGGEIDTGGNPQVLKVVQPGADHRVRILQLDRRDEVLSTLSRWLGVAITPPSALAPTGNDILLRPGTFRLR